MGEAFDQGSSDKSNWVVIGFAANKVTADYIIESLRSYDIPSALNSKSGFLGDIGMTTVFSQFGGEAGAYEVLVVEERVGEAMEIARMVAGEGWEPIIDDGGKVPSDDPSDSKSEAKAENEENKHNKHNEENK